MKQDIDYYKDQLFGSILEISPDEKNDFVEKSLEKAWEIRNFEIELYWKRTTYFFALITTIGVACYKVYSKSTLIFLLLLSSGLICSVAWFLSNIASKHWQENWEIHINLLENIKYGNLYKTTLSYYKNPIIPSVSRLNLKISFLAILIWGAAILRFCTLYFTQHPYKCILFIIFSILILVIYCWQEINLKRDFPTIFKLLFWKKDHNEIHIISKSNCQAKIFDNNE